MDKGWEEITRGADIKVPHFFRFVIQYVTPAFILVIFVGSLIKPTGEWGAAFASLGAGQGWPLAPDSVIGKILHVGVDGRWFDAEGYATRALVEDVTRLLLSFVFLGFVGLVWKAWRDKARRAQ
jgi:hypothetical protein